MSKTPTPWKKPTPMSPLPPLSKHWYLHNLCSSEERDSVRESSEFVEVVMFKESEHRQHAQKTGQRGRCGVWASVSFGGR